MSTLLLLESPLNLQPPLTPAAGGGTIPAITFRQRVLRRLNQAQGDPTGELADDTSADPIWTTDQAIDDYASEGAAILCRTCWPLLGSFTFTVPVGGARSVLYGALTAGSDTPAGAALWQPLQGGVLWDRGDGSSPVRLRYITESMLALRFRDYLSATPAAWSPLKTYYWYPVGAAGIGIYPPVLPGNGTLTVRGLYVHPPADSSSALVAMFPYLPDDLLPLLEYYVCWALAAKNLDDPVLSARGPVWRGEWDQRRAELYARLDPMLRAYFPPFTAASAAVAVGPGDQ